MRADKFFSEKFGSRTKAGEAIEKGLVLVNGKVIKPNRDIKDTDEITFVEPKENFVSNGGYKLERAISYFGFDCQGKVFADIGASTGGFTDCLLQRGAKRVYAVDVGESLLHESLQKNKNVLPMENTNARFLTKDDFPEPLDGVVADVSFISLKLILPVLRDITRKEGDIIVLVKPQFETERNKLGKSGILSPVEHVSVIKRILGYLSENQLFATGIINAPVRKGKNIEYLLRLRQDTYGAKSDEILIQDLKTLIKRNTLGELE